MDKVLLRLFANIFLISIILSGALISCFSNLTEASAVEFIVGGNGSGNSSITREGTGWQTGPSKEDLSPAQKKLSGDLLQLIDEQYLSGEESSDTLRARMVKLGQLSQEDPVSIMSALSGENSEKTARSGENSGGYSYAGESPYQDGSPYTDEFSYSAEKVYVYIYIESFANSSILEGTARLRTGMKKTTSQ